MTRNITIGVVAALIVSFITAYFIFGRPAVVQTQPAPAPRVANAVPLNIEIEYAHTYKCKLPNGMPVRNWDLADRWLPNQLSYDRYTAVNADGETKTYVALVKNTSLKPKHVRFSERKINISNGPSLEGFLYRRMLINDQQVKMESVVLFVEYNGTLEPQRFVPPPCGTPRQ